MRRNRGSLAVRPRAGASANRPGRGRSQLRDIMLSDIQHSRWRADGSIGAERSIADGSIQTDKCHALLGAWDASRRCYRRLAITTSLLRPTEPTCLAKTGQTVLSRALEA